MASVPTQFGFIPIPQKFPPVAIIAAEAVRLELRNEAEKNKNIDYDDLCGGCAIAARWLKESLDLLNIKSKVVLSRLRAFGYHAYNLVNNHVLDITATQFSLDPIFISPLKGNLLNHRPDKVFSSSEEFIKTLEQMQWEPSTFPRNPPARLLAKIDKIGLDFGLIRAIVPPVVDEVLT
jgi:hypothetical protein